VQQTSNFISQLRPLELLASTQASDHADQQRSDTPEPNAGNLSISMVIEEPHSLIGVEMGCISSASLRATCLSLKLDETFGGVILGWESYFPQDFL
jgi:hypothetical protein